MEKSKSILAYLADETTELYYITGGSARRKKCPQKHGGFWPEMTPLPWLLVPPAHEKTTDQAQN